MKNTFGESVSVTLFGESHGPAVGAVLDGMAPGIPVDPEFIDRQMSYRKSVSSLSTARKEPDTVKVISGVFEGKTTGTPIVFLIENSDTRSADYDSIKTVARPGHADYTAYCTRFYTVHSAFLWQRTAHYSNSPRNNPCRFYSTNRHTD